MEPLSIQPTQSSILLFLPIFLTIYLTGYFIIFKNWPPKFRPEGASCFISLFHGTPAAILAIFSLLNNNSSHQSFFSQNTLLQNTILDYSISYFIMDLTHYLIFYPSDLLFIGHHLATLFVFITCRYLVSHGAFSILVLLILAEITSLLQNLWTLANAKRVESELAEKIYSILSLPFYVIYTIARVILGPLFVYKMGFSYFKGDGNGIIPTWVIISWICVIVTAITVSILWIWNLWVELFRQWREKKVQ
ncbi:TLC domain-containing protein At5g14285-like [Chenopodium quinoa]|uniref:TLC domain-containing protein At5g14285-like n=1 Tax=Chenopodium quinoa TaxID=63459 RepID=UPI000B76F438|nr:TLC domain-containing protein At5g14285-like [Chenopodium quinoa]